MERAIDTKAVCLRPEAEADRDFLFQVFASTREVEMNLFDWDGPQKEAFLRQQFQAQYSHYHAHYAGADFNIIECDGRSVGRLCVNRTGHEIRIVDISLLPEFRGQGIGTSLLEEIFEEGTVSGFAVSLHVEKHNPAQSLYRRLGFEIIEDQGIYWLMLRRSL